MDFTQLLTIFGMYGGFELIKWGITTYRNKENIKIKETADADTARLTNLSTYAEEWKEHYEELKRDNAIYKDKVNELYSTIGELRAKEIQHIKDVAERDVLIEKLKKDKCQVSRCPNRIPPEINENGK